LSDFSACAEQKKKNQERSMKEKKAENSRQQSIDLKKCLSLQFFSLSLSIS
jgi:hypothetical protein